MTQPTVMDKDKLAAFVDGELSPEEAARVVMHLADHPQDQAYVDDLMAANAALSLAFSAPVTEPVPPRFQDLILGAEAPAAAPSAEVLRFPKGRRRLPVAAAWGGLALGGALAAGLALAVVLPAGAPQGLVLGPLAEGSPMAEALAVLPSGTPLALDTGHELMVLASVPTPAGFCREIEVTGAQTDSLQAALVCTQGAGWMVEVILSEQLTDASGADGFATASGAEAQSFTPFLDRIGAGPVLSPEDEARAIAQSWAN